MAKKLFSPGLIAKIVILCLLAGAAIDYKLRLINWRHYRVLGKNPLESLQVVENHKLALSRWAAAGIKNAVLINVDAHDDLKRVSGAKVEELRKFLAESAKQGADDEPKMQLIPEINGGNFIYAAAKLGMIKEVYWVVPSADFKSGDPKGQLIPLLQHHGFRESDIRTFRMEGDNFRYKGWIDGIPLNICSLESLPPIREPVVLSIDADFFPLAAEVEQERLLTAVKRTSLALFSRKYRIRHAVVAYSVDEGHLSTYHRWVGDLFIEIAKKPELAYNEVFPESYALLQQAELLHMMNRNSELLDYLLPYYEKGARYPPLLMYLAHALAEVGADTHAFLCAETACKANDNYCYGLCEIGCRLLATSTLGKAEKFFLRAYELNPRMAHSQFKLAQALKTAGRFDDAIRYFKIFRDEYGPFPADFYLGEVFLMRGDQASAEHHFNTAKEAIVASPDLWAGFGDVGIVQQAIAFYERKGRADSAQVLRTSLGMREQDPAGSPHVMPR